MLVNFKKVQCFIPLFVFLMLLVAVFVTIGLEQQYLVLAVLMFLLPLLDSLWKMPAVAIAKKDVISVTFLILIVIAVVTLKPVMLNFFFITLVFIALPEEWFFRAYLMTKIGNGLKANVITSIGFSALHAITISWVAGVMVFIPSLVFGLIYQKQGNILLVTLIHAISNLVYAAYLYQYLLRYNLY